MYKLFVDPDIVSYTPECPLSTARTLWLSKLVVLNCQTFHHFSQVLTCPVLAFSVNVKAHKSSFPVLILKKVKSVSKGLTTLFSP